MSEGKRSFQLIELCPVSESDHGAVAEMAASIWPIAYGDILSSEQLDYMITWMYSPEAMLRDVADGVEYVWIQRGGHRLGFLAFGPVRSGEECPLHKFYVLSGAQGQGVGSATMQALFTRLNDRGATGLWLRVNRENARAIRFYEKNGFLVRAEDCKDIGNGYVMDDHIMARSFVS